MNLDDLRYFVEIVRHVSIQRAAAELGVPAGTLSKALARLEERTGVSFFDRRRQRLFLNEAGQSFAGRAIQILQLAETALAELGTGERTVSVRVCAPETLAAAVVPGLIRALDAAGFTASWQVERIEDTAIGRRVESRQAQIGITSMKQDGNLRYVRLGASRSVAVVGKSHPFHQRRAQPVHVSELLEQTFVVPHEPLLWSMTRSASGVSSDGWRDDRLPRRKIIRVDGLHALLEFVRLGLGVGYVPENLIDSKCSVLNVEGCPYVCRQEWHLVHRQPIEWGWIPFLIKRTQADSGEPVR